MRSFLFLTASMGVLAFANLANAEQVATRATATPAVNIQNINPGQTINSNLSPSDMKLEADGSPIEIFKVRVRSGQRVTATMSSKAFSSILNIGNVQTAADCEECEAAAQDDKDAAVARYTAKSDGFVYIRTNSLNASDSGDYTLNVVVADPPRVTYTPLTFGRVAQGRLSDSDITNDEGKNTDNFSLNLSANRRVQIDLTSEEFDPIVTITGPNKSSANAQIAQDDDGGPGTNARIRFTPEVAGVYKINVTSIGEEAKGAYTLLVGAVPPRAPLPAPQAISIGATSNAIMPTSGPKEEIDGEDVVTQRFRFVAVAGKTYAIDVKSKAFDPMVEVGTYKENGDFESIKADDDGGSGTDSLLRFKAEKAGPIVIRVRETGISSEEGAENSTPKGGAYTISVNNAIIAPAPSAGQPISVGQTIDGNLKDGGPRREDDTLYNAYSINLTKGQKVTIEMKDNSPEEQEDKLDSFLEIGLGTPANFVKSTEDDDGGKELNAKIRFEAPETGAYLIRASTAAASGVGPYKLSVVNTPPAPPPPTPIAIGVGETKEGSLVEADAVFGNDDQHYKLYTFTAAAGSTYVIELESDDFDPIVYSKASGANDSTYESDDDGGAGDSGLNSKLEVKVENAGPQTIRIAAVDAEGLGKFKLKLSRK